MANKKGSQNNIDADNAPTDEDGAQGLTTSQFVSVDDTNPDGTKGDPDKTIVTTATTARSETETDLEEAALRGDAAAIARLRFANQAREENEHIDVYDDGEHDEPEPEILSTLFTRDEYGGFVATDGDYYDSFGGHYDGFGYTSENGSYTNRSGEGYNAATNEFTEKTGKPMEVPESVKQMAAEDKTAGATFLSMAEAEQQRIDHGANGKPDPKAGLDGKKPSVNAAAASKGEGQGQTTDGKTTSVQARETAAIGTTMQQDDKHSGRHVKKDYQYLPEA